MDEANTNAEPEVKKVDWSRIAAETFGSSYYGEVKETPEAPAQAAPDTEVEKVDSDVEAQADMPEETAATESDSEEQPISSFRELVEHFELDPEAVDNLLLDVKINGETGKMTLKEAKAVTQTLAAAEQRLNDAKEKAKEITTSLEQRQEKLNEQFAVAASFVDEQRQALDQELADLNRGNLKKIDPADYAARKLDIQDKRQALDEKIAKLTNSYQESIQKNQAQLETEFNNYRAQEQEALLKAVPEWSNPDTFKKEGSELIQYLVNSGISEDEAKGLIDHRYITLARKAWLFDQSQSKAKPAKEKLKKIPLKSVAPGPIPSADKSQLAEIARLEAKLKKSGSVEDAVAVRRAKAALMRK